MVQVLVRGIRMDEGFEHGECQKGGGVIVH